MTRDGDVVWTSSGRSDCCRSECVRAARRGTRCSSTLSLVHPDHLDASTLSLVHTVPLAGRGREAGIAAILDRPVAERTDVSFLRAWNPVFPDRLLRERGFLSDDRPPLSWTGSPDLRLAAHSLSGEPVSDAALPESGATLRALDE